MSIVSVQFPSVFEAAYGNTENTAASLLTGMKVKVDSQWYLVGDLARKNGVNAQRVVNASPDQIDFEILFKSALLNCVDVVEKPFNVTLGLPYSTYNAYRQPLMRLMEQRYFTVDFNSETYKVDGGVRSVNIELKSFDVIPEIVGAMIGIKKGNVVSDTNPRNFIVISLGYGTAEGGMATDDGLLQRTCFSVHGIRYVVNNLQRELNKQHYLDMKNEFQLNDSLMKGFMIASRKRIDLRDMRKEIISNYYKQVISPNFRSHFTDQDFERCTAIYLVGGGILYNDLKNEFEEEFKGFLPVEVVSEPQNVASMGYYFHSEAMSGGSPANSVGLDIGNSSTIFTYSKVS
jgi:plasmid segregation protein ParM